MVPFFSKMLYGLLVLRFLHTAFCVRLIFCVEMFRFPSLPLWCVFRGFSPLVAVGSRAARCNGSEVAAVTEPPYLATFPSTDSCVSPGCVCCPCISPAGPRAAFLAGPSAGGEAPQLVI